MSKVNKEYQLQDKYLLESGRVFLTGTQALVRLPLMQRQKDLSEGLNTAGYISGYTGSPLGGYDHALNQASDLLKENHIVFQPGINEDMAATAVHGSQQSNLIDNPSEDLISSFQYTNQNRSGWRSDIVLKRRIKKIDESINDLNYVLGRMKLSYNKIHEYVYGII